MEPVVRGVYEKMLRRRVDPLPFRIHSRLCFLGATPDGGVGDSGLVEFKAPVHQLYGDTVPAHYMAQVWKNPTDC